MDPSDFHPGLSEILAPDGSQEVFGHTHKWPVLYISDFTLGYQKCLHLMGSSAFHPGLSEIPAPNGSQDVMSQLEDYYPVSQWLGAGW